jgi:hypothetical protein
MCFLQMANLASEISDLLSGIVWMTVDFSSSFASQIPTPCQQNWSTGLLTHNKINLELHRGLTRQVLITLFGHLLQDVNNFQEGKCPFYCPGRLFGQWEKLSCQRGLEAKGAHACMLTDTTIVVYIGTIIPINSLWHYSRKTEIVCSISIKGWQQQCWPVGKRAVSPSHSLH